MPSFKKIGFEMAKQFKKQKSVSISICLSIYLYELVSVYYMVLATTVVDVAVGLGCKLGRSFRLTRVLASTLTIERLLFVQ